MGTGAGDFVAKQAADEEEAKVRRGTWRDPAAGQETFGEYASRWYDAQDLAASTTQNYRRHIEEHLLPEFEDKARAGILRTDVDTWEKREKAVYDEFVAVILKGYTGMRWGEIVGLETEFARPGAIRVEHQMYELDSGELIRCPPGTTATAPSTRRTGCRPCSPSTWLHKPTTYASSLSSLVAMSAYHASVRSHGCGSFEADAAPALTDFRGCLHRRVRARGCRRGRGRSVR
ncbi:hypothetical protein QFZ43_003994 [Streptomyces afghaniensis]|nr:hypothetical protein [Streptomyces afghaniensis]